MRNGTAGSFCRLFFGLCHASIMQPAIRNRNQQSRLFYQVVSVGVSGLESAPGIEQLKRGPAVVPDRGLAAEAMGVPRLSVDLNILKSGKNGARREYIALVRVVLVPNHPASYVHIVTGNIAYQDYLLTLKEHIVYEDRPVIFNRSHA